MVLFQSSDKIKEKVPVSFNRFWLRAYPRESIFHPVFMKFTGKEKKNCTTCLGYSLTNGFSVFKILPLGCSCITEHC